MKDNSDKMRVLCLSGIWQWFVLNQQWILRQAVPLAILFFFLYFPTWKWLIDTWSHDKPYSHGFFVPFIFFYLVRLKREELRNIHPRPAWLSGGLILIFCCLLLLLGRIGAIVQLEVVSLYFFVPGVILFVWGWRTLKALWFPVFFLQFMIPWIDPFLKYVYPVFRRIAATLGTWFLSLHYPVMQAGTSIYLPNITLSVIDACSGINFFISVTAVGLLLAYLTQKSWKRVLVVLLAGGAVTVLANGIRVALAGVMGQEYGANMLHGPGHIFRGWFVAQLGWIMIFLVNWLVGRIPHPETLHLYERWKGSLQQGEKEEPVTGKTTRTSPSSVILFVLLLSFAAYLNFFAQPVPVSLPVSLSTLPMEIGPWRGSTSQWLPKGEYFPGADPELERSYHTGSGKTVHLYIGYFAVQKNNARLVSYHSRSLFQGKKSVPLIKIEKNKQTRAGISHAEIGPLQYQILFWYQFPDTTLGNGRRVKLKGVVDALMRHRNNGAIVLIASPVPANKKSDEINKDLASFASLVAPDIRAMFVRGRP